MHPQLSGLEAKKARESAKLSQAVVANALGLNRTYYSLYESDRLALTDAQYTSLFEFLSARGVTTPVDANDSTAEPVEARTNSVDGMKVSMQSEPADDEERASVASQTPTFSYATTSNHRAIGCDRTNNRATRSTRNRLCLSRTSKT